MRRTKMSKYTAKIMALLLSVAMTFTAAFPVNAASEKEDKKETVYVNANADGSVDKVTVSAQLSGQKKGNLEDYSNLSNIENVKGDETFTQSADGSLTWNSTGEDIFYQGESNENLPFSMKVTYYLDGKEIEPEKLIGKSGTVKMRFDYTVNNQETVKVDGEDMTVQTPFSFITAMILPSETFSNIQVENGKNVSDGDKNIVIGMAIPGLEDSLKLDSYEPLSDVDIPDYVEVTADVKDFQLALTATVAATGSLNDLNLDDIEDVDDLKDDIDELTDGSSQLVEGCGDLVDGMETLSSSMKTYTKGVDDVNDGAKELKDGLKTLDNNKQSLNQGTNDLTNGISELKNGTTKLETGIKAYTAGASSLQEGINTAATGASDLKNGAAVLSKSIKDYTDGATQIQAGLSQINSQLSSASTSMPDEKQMAEVQAAATKLEQDAQSLQEQAQTLSNLITQLGQLETGLNSYQTAVKKQAAEKANNVSQTSHDNAVAAVKSALDQLGENEISSEAKEKVLAAVTNSDVASVTSDDITVNIPFDIDTTVDATGLAALAELLKDMSSQAGILEQFGADMSGLTSQLPELEKGIDTLNAGATKLTKNNDQLVAGAEALSSGTDALNTGLATLKAGASDLTKNNEELKEGAESLSAGATTLETGSSKLEKAMRQVTKVVSLLTKGSTKLADGTGTLSKAGEKLNGGVGELLGGSQDLRDGMKELDEEGIQKIADLAGDDLQQVIKQFKAVKEADEKYQSYSGMKEGAKGSVKFIIETAPLE